MIGLCTILSPAPVWAEMGLYGQALVSLDYVDSQDYPGPDNDKPLALNGNRSWLGFQGKEGLREDLALLWRAEVYLDLDDGGWGEGREAYLGLRHRFGTLRVGKQSTPYRLAGERLDVFADTRGDYHGVIGNIDGEAVFGNRMKSLLFYQTPQIKRFQLALGFSPAYESQGDADHYGLSAALTFDNGPLYVALAYEQLQDYVSSLPQYAAAASGNARAAKLALGWDFGQGSKLGLILEDAKNGARLNGDEVLRRAYYLNFSQLLGNVTLRAAVGLLDQLDAVKDSGAKHLALGLSYAFSPRADVFAQAAWTSNDNGGAYGLVADSDDPSPLLPAQGEDMTAVSLGLRYRFDWAL
ncbi:MAG: porin [Gammaproteobacteria bacterium]